MIETKLKRIFKSILNSYSQIFFSDNKIFAFILLVVSFFDVYVGIAGLFSIIVSNTIAFSLGFNKKSIETGLYGFNSLLVGLGIGLYFQASIELYVILFLIAILTLFLSLMFEGFFSKYGLPFLSIPFIFAMWAILLASRDFTVLGISHRGIYTLNEIYSIGGKDLVDFYKYIDSIQLFFTLKIYFLSLGAIFFQYNVIAGILIAIGLLIYSRIAFSLSLIGFYSAILFYQLIGADITILSYSYIGFNFILTAIAIGGFFVIPSYSSYLWTAFLLPIVVIITISLSSIFSIYQLSIYSLPFNFVTLLFIYVLKLRVLPSKRIVNNFTQYNSPEKNLYNYKNNLSRFKDAFIFPISLPFFGTWSVSQAHNGEYTHKEEWKHAWDFIVKDADNKQFANFGNRVSDYYCYGKSIIAPASGIIQQITDNVEDNLIGNVNLDQNWGNSIVIKHADGLFSQISHIKKGTYKVVVGQEVKKGEILASCGNSGHSPYPHVHFQIQATPFIGSKTINYPISNYIIENNDNFELKFYEIPKENDRLSNIQTNILLKQDFDFTPGQTIKASVKENSLNKKMKLSNESWKIYVDIYKQTYFYCEETKSTAYFTNDGSLFQFTKFTGNKNSILFYYYLSLQKFQLGYYKGLKIEDNISIDLMFSKIQLILQDFTAPFFIYLSSKYNLRYTNLDDNLSPTKIDLEASISNRFFGKDYSKIDIKISLNRKEANSFLLQKNNKTLLFEVESH